jgi:hypothetical protein
MSMKSEPMPIAQTPAGKARQAARFTAFAPVGLGDAGMALFRELPRV